MTEGLDPGAECLEFAFVGEAQILQPERGFVAEGMVVDEGEEAEELHHVVLERSRREKDLAPPEKREPERLASDIVLPPRIPDSVRLVDDHKVPADPANELRLRSRELVARYKDEPGLVEGITITLTNALFEASPFQDEGRKIEFLRELCEPLLPEARRQDEEDAPFILRPLLRDDDAGLDGLAEAHLVREEDSPRQGGAEGSQRGVYLVGIQVDLGSMMLPARVS